MQPHNWEDPSARSVGLLLEGKAQASGVREYASDASLRILINAYHEGVTFQLPDEGDTPIHWTLVLSTDTGLNRHSLPGRHGTTSRTPEAA